MATYLITTPVYYQDAYTQAQYLPAGSTLTTPVLLSPIPSWAIETTNGAYIPGAPLATADAATYGAAFGNSSASVPPWTTDQ
jgi:hypothetical protein